MSEDEVLIIAADSLENLRSGDRHEAVIGDLKNEDVVIIGDLAAEDDEGLGDINHGSEASRYRSLSLQPEHKLTNPYHTD